MGNGRETGKDSAGEKKNYVDELWNAIFGKSRRKELRITRRRAAWGRASAVYTWNISHFTPISPAEVATDASGFKRTAWVIFDAPILPRNRKKLMGSK